MFLQLIFKNSILIWLNAILFSCLNQGQFVHGGEVNRLGLNISESFKFYCEACRNNALCDKAVVSF